jgi:hypothetical protein
MGFLFKSIKNGYLSIKFYSLFVLSFKVNWIFNLSILFLLVNFLNRNTDVSAYLNSFQPSIFSLFDFNMRDVFYAMCNQNTLALQGVGTLDNASAIEGNVHITILQVTGDQNSSSQEFNYQKYKAEIDVNNLKLAMDHTEKMVESIKSNPSLSENDKEIQIRRWIEDMAKDTTEMAKATKTLMDIDNSGENIASPSNKRAISDVGSDEIVGKRKA